MKAVMVGMAVVLISIGQQAQQPTSASGSIAGRVVPEYTGLNVSLSRYVYDENGELKLVGFKTARTSSEIGKFGEFRFENVEPGEYYISANPFGLSAPKGQVWTTTYYPGTVDLGRASRIALKPGDDLQLSDLSFLPVQQRSQSQGFHDRACPVYLPKHKKRPVVRVLRSPDRCHEANGRRHRLNACKNGTHRQDENPWSRLAG